METEFNHLAANDLEIWKVNHAQCTRHYWRLIKDGRDGGISTVNELDIYRNDLGSIAELNPFLHVSQYVLLDERLQPNCSSCWWRSLPMRWMTFRTAET